MSQYQVRFNCDDVLYKKIKAAAAKQNVSMSAFIKSMVVPEVPKDMELPTIKDKPLTKNIPIWLTKDEYNFIKYRSLMEDRSMSYTVIDIMKKVKPSLFGIK